MRIFRCFLILILLGVSSGLAMADTVAPGDPHMIPGRCSGCGSISVGADNAFPTVSTGGGSFAFFFNNATGAEDTWNTLEIVIGGVLTDTDPTHYNFTALLSSTTSGGDCPTGTVDPTCFRAFNTPLSVIVAGGETFLFYPKFTGDGVGGVASGKDLILAGELFNPNTPMSIQLFANDTGPAVPVPEPGTLALLLAGMAGVVGRRKLRGNRADRS